MSTYNDGDRVSLETAVDLSTNRFFLAKRDANGRAVLAAAATDNIVGVIDDGGRKASDTADVVLANGNGTYKVKLGGTIAAGDFLTSDANGKAVKATQTTAGAQPTVRVIGQAIFAGVTGDVAQVIKKDFLY